MSTLSKIKDLLSAKSKKNADRESQEDTMASSSGTTPASTPIAIAPIPIDITQPSPKQDVPSTIPLASPHPTVSPAVQSPGQLIPSDQTRSGPPSGDDLAVEDIWTRAYRLVQERESDLMGDYKKHLAFLQGNPEASADLSAPRSVKSIVERLWKDREERQWRLPLPGKDVRIGEQIQKFANFLLWSDGIVKTAVSGQPYAALAWSGVTLLLPVGGPLDVETHAYRICSY